MARMADSTDWPLPTADDWSFNHFPEEERAWATRLDNAGAPAALIDAVCDALASTETLYGWEVSDSDGSHHRALIQFPVAPDLFDWFFNARTGYRAHFRAHPDCGLSFNADVVRALRDRLRRRLPSSVSAVRVDRALNVLGEVPVPRTDFVRSLDPALAKFWAGTVAIGGGYRGLGVSGPKIRVGLDRWPARYMVGRTWLDLKGAFDGNGKLYQPKCPRLRAIKLHETGAA
jgi:hypothetical protein